MHSKWASFVSENSKLFTNVQFKPIIIEFSTNNQFYLSFKVKQFDQELMWVYKIEN